MRRTPLVLLALAVAGCGYVSDPATSTLKTGQAVVIYRNPPGTGYCLVDTSDGEPAAGVTIGTRATVIDDKAGDGDRPVRIRVAEGKNADLVGTLPRLHLRPAP